MPVTSENTIRELIAERPVAARILSNHQIDFCANAKRTIDEVCRERRISSPTILREIDTAFHRTAASERDWSGEPLSELIAYILLKHHGYLRTELAWMETMVRRVNDKHGQNHTFLAELQDVVIALREELDMHLHKEEMVLFPYIGSIERTQAGGAPPSSSCFGSIENPIRMMEYEHDSAQAALERIRALTSDYMVPPDTCLSFRILFGGLQSIDADLQVHIRLENEVLHPRAKRLEQSVLTGAASR